MSVSVRHNGEVEPPQITFDSHRSLLVGRLQRIVRRCKD